MSQFQRSKRCVWLLGGPCCVLSNETERKPQVKTAFKDTPTISNSSTLTHRNSQETQPEDTLLTSTSPSSELQATLFKRFYYDEVTGAFTYRDNGQEAGWLNTGTSNGMQYRRVRINKRCYQVHKLIWLYMTGEQVPEGLQIDHIDRNPLNNRWSNLRIVTGHQNLLNRGIRFSVPYLSKRNNKWRVQHKASRTYLSFDSFSDAGKAALVIYLNLPAQSRPTYLGGPLRDDFDYGAELGVLPTETEFLYMAIASSR